MMDPVDDLTPFINHILTLLQINIAVIPNAVITIPITKGR